MIGLGSSVAGANIQRESNTELIKLRTPLSEVDNVLITALIWGMSFRGLHNNSSALSAGISSSSKFTF